MKAREEETDSHRQIDLDEHIMYVAESINESIATDCKTFRPRRPLPTVYKTHIFTQSYVVCQALPSNSEGGSMKVGSPSSVV